MLSLEADGLQGQKTMLNYNDVSHEQESETAVHAGSPKLENGDWKKTRKHFCFVEDTQSYSAV